MDVERTFSKSKMCIGDRQHRKSTPMVFAQVLLHEKWLRDNAKKASAPASKRKLAT